MIAQYTDLMYFLSNFMLEQIKTYHNSNEIQEQSLKEHFDVIPSLEDLNNLYLDGIRIEAILVNAEKDKKLSMLKQLILTLVKGLNSNTAAVIKKIAGLVKFS